MYYDSNILTSYCDIDIYTNLSLQVIHQLRTKINVLFLRLFSRVLIITSKEPSIIVCSTTILYDMQFIILLIYT